MKDLPPQGSRRWRAAIGIWVALTALFAVLLVYGLYRWTMAKGEFPVLAAVGGIGGFIAVWRWIVEQSRRAV